MESLRIQELLSLVLKAWKIPREHLVFGLHWRPEEADSNISEKNAAVSSNRIDEPAGKS